jgi:tetratricopeptide (TPR) repeat protein
MNDALLNDRYLITAELGRGGMGVVYRANDTLLGRDVAIKVMSVSELGTGGQARLMQEARAAASLNHPNVVAVHDVGEAQLPGQSESSSYIVMELVEGQLLNTYKPASLNEVIEIGRQICAALEEAHDNGIIHRDLKPENVILTRSQVIKLMDFGLARSSGATRLTQEGALVGTLSYIAPEVIIGRPATERSDLYAFGVMLYELAAGRPPFTGDNLTAVISQHLHAPVVPPSAINEKITPPLDRLILQLLNKQPEARPGSAAEVGELLDLIQAGKGEQLTDATGEVATLNRLVRGRLIGRESELEQATTLWQQVTLGSGQVLLISGEPGIGKTRLVQELITIAEISRGRVFSAECYAEGAVPYMPVAQMIRDALRDGFQLQLPEEVMVDLVTLAPELRLSFPDLPQPLPLDPKSEQSRLFESIVTLCQVMTESAPVMLFFDDVHWADSGTLSLIRHLARRMRRQPLMIVSTYREVDIDEGRPFRDMMLDLRREKLTQRIKLSRLDQEGTKALLATLLTEEITPEFLEGIYQETEGNPFFVEEVCKALVESGELYFEDGRWHRPSMEELEIPQGVRDTIQSRVGKLPPEVQELLRMAAILGREFDFDTLLEAVDQDENNLIDILERAEEAQLIEEVGSLGTVSFAFAHALIPATLVEGVRTLRRRRLHRRAAEAIEQIGPEDYESLAYHYSEAGDEDHALKYYHLAGDRASAVYANKEAEAHYLAALDIVHDDEQRLAILTNLGTVLTDQSRHEEAISTWRTGIELAQSMGRMNDVAELYGRSARAAWDGGDTPRGLALGKEGLELVAGASTSRGYAHLLHETARAYLFNGLLDEAEPLCRQAMKMAKEVGALDVQVQALTTMSLLPAYSVDDSILMLKEAVSLAESAGLLREAERAVNNQGIYQFWGRGDFAEAIKQAKHARKIAHTRGDLASELLSSIGPINAEIHLGNLSSAKRSLEKAFTLLEMVAEPGTGAFGYYWVEAMLERAYGDVNHAIMLLGELADGARTSGDLQMLQIALNDLGEYLVTEDRFEEAAAIIEEAVELGDKGLVGGDVKTHCLKALVFIKTGDEELAHIHYQEAERKNEANGYRFADRIWLPWTLAHLSVAQGQWTKAWTAFEEAVEVVTSYKAHWYRAKWQLEWAEALLQRGQKDDKERAMKLLQETQTAFEAMGAGAYVEQSVKLIDLLS